jgi:uncharacterized membrane protein
MEVYIVILAVVLTLVVAPIVMLIVAFVRSSRINDLARRLERLEMLPREPGPGTVGASTSPASRISEVETSAVDELTRRVERLEMLVREQATRAVGVPATPSPLTPEVELRPVVAREPARTWATAAAPPSASRVARAPATATPTVPFDWEWFIGRRALGWVAVVLIIFATAFFLRYAFENNWIGPLGRVAITAAGGLALVAGGYHYDRKKRWHRFAQMLTAAGVVLFYLATYSAFGFYHLLPQRSAAVFLLIIVVETMVLAAQYEAPALALVATLGGLLTPVLMQSETDQYTSLFVYLALIDVGVVILALRRPWPVVTSVALLGTQLLFWSWYNQNYHPEKLHAALAFQAAVFVLFLGQILATPVVSPSRSVSLSPLARVAAWESLGRWLANASLGFTGFYVLLKPDNGPWMGTLALALATLYAELARWMLPKTRDDSRLFLTTLAIAVGFIAAAVPIQADASWIALGWAAEAGALWWFGLRVSQRPLRALAAALAVMSMVRLIFVDTFDHPHSPALPVLNTYALPAIAATVCLLIAVVATRKLQHGLDPTEALIATTAPILVILQLWLVLSVDLYGYCRAHFGSAAGNDERFAQMALSLLWAVYASAVLGAGFRFHSARLRWTALGLYGVTVAKVFLFDMAGLDELYRILAFFVLALLLGAAAAVYQRLRPQPQKAGTLEV